MTRLNKNIRNALSEAFSDKLWSELYAARKKRNTRLLKIAKEQLKPVDSALHELVQTNPQHPVADYLAPYNDTLLRRYINVTSPSHVKPTPVEAHCWAAPSDTFADMDDVGPKLHYMPRTDILALQISDDVRAELIDGEKALDDMRAALSTRVHAFNELLHACRTYEELVAVLPEASEFTPVSCLSNLADKARGSK